MKYALVILIAVVGVTSAETSNSPQKRSNSGYTKEQLDGYQGYDEANNEASQLEIDNKGYSTGSGLRSIAQGSARQANTAAVKQHTAAVQAAYLAQTTLAQTAIQAAATANAALAGKEVLLDNVEKHNLDSIHALNNEVNQLEISKKASILAKQSAQLSANHVSILTAALNNAQQLAEQAERAARKAEAELASQIAMVGEAKGKLDSISNKLIAAKIDFEATKDAANKATSAAEEAQSNAASAGAHASLKLHEAAGLTQGFY